MKALVFDTGPVISLATNNLLWLLEDLKKKFKGEFYLSEATKRELVDKPLVTKRFKLEALQVLQYFNKGVLKLIENNKTKEQTVHLLELANNSFMAKNHYLRLVHYAEIAGLASCLYLKANTFVVDERTTRVLIENPVALKSILQHKLHTKITINEKNVDEFRNKLKNIRLIRSIELVTIAYELGLLDRYIANIKKQVEYIKNPKETLLDSVLWGVKLHGCSVSDEEIEEIIKLEVK